jgi:hypothetical protein
MIPPRRPHGTLESVARKVTAICRCRPEISHFEVPLLILWAVHNPQMTRNRSWVREMDHSVTAMASSTTDNRSAQSCTTSQ